MRRMTSLAVMVDRVTVLRSHCCSRYPIGAFGRRAMNINIILLCSLAILVTPGNESRENNNDRVSPFLLMDDSLVNL